MINKLSYTQGKYIGKLETYARFMAASLIKCIVYGNSSGQLQYWLQTELLRYVQCMMPHKDLHEHRLTEKEYFNLLQEPLGDEKSDCQLTLEYYIWQYQGISFHYIATDKQIDQLWNIYNKLYLHIAKILAEDNRQLFLNLVQYILDLFKDNDIWLD